MVATLTTENHSLRNEVETKIHTAVSAAEDALHTRLAIEWADRMQQEISSALAEAATQHEIVLQECREEQEKRVEEMTLSMRQQAIDQEVPSGGISNHTYIPKFTVHAHIISSAYCCLLHPSSILFTLQTRQRLESEDLLSQKLGEQAYMFKLDQDKATAALELSWQATVRAKEQELKVSFEATQQTLKTKHGEELEAEKARWLDQHSKTLASALLQCQQEGERVLAERTATHVVALQEMELQHKVYPIPIYPPYS